MSTLNLAEGESFVKGRSTKKAAELLGFAGAERTSEVRTTSHGYIVPSDILPEGYAAITRADLPAVTTEPGTPTRAEDVHNVRQDRNAPVGTPLAEADNAVSGVRNVPDGALVADPANPAGKHQGDQGETYFSQGPVDFGAGAAATAPAAEEQDADEDAEDVTEEDSTPATEETEEVTEEQVPAVELYDPKGHTVDEVKAYLEAADDDERARVIAAEEASDTPRKTVLGLATTPEGAK